jgi:hypothetical protein
MTLTLPATPSKHNLFALQPISAYMNGLRAVATSVLYRYARINCGYGAWDEEYVSPSTSTDAAVAAALNARFYPIHIIQIVLAEWLAVYAGMQNSAAETVPLGSFMAFPDTSFAGTIYNNPRDVLSNKDNLVATMAEGNTLLSPAAIVVFLVDWYGLTRPILMGRQDNSSSIKEWRQLKNKAFALRPSTFKPDSCIGTAYAAGLQLPALDVITQLNKIFTHNEDTNPHKLQLVLTHLTGDLEPYNLKNMYESTCRFTNSQDYLIRPYKDSHELAIPQHVKFTSESAMDIAISKPGCVCLAFNKKKGQLHSVLHVETDAPLQYVCADATIATIVAALPDVYESHFHNEVVAQAWKLYPVYLKHDIDASAKRSMHMKFGATPVVGTALHTAPVPADVSSTITAAIQNPKMLRPGRWFTKGPPMVALFFPPTLWYQRDFQTMLTRVTRFFEKVKVVREGRGQAYLIKDNVPQYEIVVTKRAESGYGLAPLANRAAVTAANLPDITGLPLWSIHFSKENLLWLAAVPNNRPREIIAELWTKHHVVTATARRTTDATSNRYFRAALQGKLEQAAAWQPGLLAEMVFSNLDNEAHMLVMELDQDFIQATAVVLYNGVYYYGTQALGKDLVATHVFENTFNALNIQQLRAPQTLSDKDITTRSLYLQRSFDITTTQLALLYAFGSANQIQDLHTMSNLGLQETVNIPGLKAVSDVDHHEISQRLQYMSSTEGVSLLSAAVTLS